MSVTRNPRVVSALRMATAAAVVLFAAACSPSDEPDGARAEGANGIDLPEAWVDADDLTVPVIIYPPYGSKDDDGKLVGLIPDLGQAIADTLGVDVTFKEEVFDNMLPGVQSGTYMMTLAVVLTDERLEAFDFSTMTAPFTTFVVPESAPDIGDKTTDICGLTVGSVAASTQSQELKRLSSECDEAGLEEIKVSEYKDLASAYLAVRSGNVDAMAAGYAGALAIAEANPEEAKVTGPRVLYVKESIATQKDSGAAESVTEAMNVLIENGTYQELLEKWGMTTLAIEESETNPQP